MIQRISQYKDGGSIEIKFSNYFRHPITNDVLIGEGDYILISHEIGNPRPGRMYVCRVGSAAREEIMDLYVVAKILEEVNAHISHQASLLDVALKLVSIGYKQDFETENEQ